jgi:hypothetical protein
MSCASGRLEEERRVIKLLWRDLLGDQLALSFVMRLIGWLSFDEAESCGRSC